jgi:hypothetical protein
VVLQDPVSGEQAGQGGWDSHFIPVAHAPPLVPVHSSCCLILKYASLGAGQILEAGLK